jgi:hypothetical protein
LIFYIFINYSRLIEKLFKGHLERAEIELDKLAAPWSPIELSLKLNYFMEFENKRYWNKKNK